VSQFATACSQQLTAEGTGFGHPGTINGHGQYRVTKETLDLRRQRFDAGVTDNVEVVLAQESLTSAELDVINSIFAHNMAKLSLARSIASAADNLQQFLSLQ
jgi:outer membrane protein TolC